MIAIVVQARMSSTRLPGKVLADLRGKPALERIIDRLRQCRSADALLVATSTDSSDDPIEALCRSVGCAVHRGSLQDVLSRYAGAARRLGADHVVRVTADCPLIDPEIVDQVVALHLERGTDYTSNTLTRTYPDGLDVEVVTASALYRAEAEASDAISREHVMPFFYRPGTDFRIAQLTSTPDRSLLRWTVDHPLDLEFVRAVYARLPDPDTAVHYRDTLAAAEQVSTTGSHTELKKQV
jgi:spore coat polysaccharide biosynthesis protein SpsF